MGPHQLEEEARQGYLRNRQYASKWVFVSVYVHAISPRKCSRAMVLSFPSSFSSFILPETSKLWSASGVRCSYPLRFFRFSFIRRESGSILLSMNSNNARPPDTAYQIPARSSAIDLVFGPIEIREPGHLASQLAGTLCSRPLSPALALA